MAAGDGDVKLGTLGSGSESSSEGGSENPGGAGATAEGGGWAEATLALLWGGGEMLLNVALVALVLLGAYRLWVRWGRRGLGAGAGAGEESPAASLPRMKKRDFSLEQLRQYDGSRTPRILLAVNGKVFDVTKGSKFYGPAGPYGIFAGRDASRGLATFCLDKDALRDEYDDLSDLNAVQMESVREWEMQFKGKKHNSQAMSEKPCLHPTLQRRPWARSSALHCTIIWAACDYFIQEHTWHTVNSLV
ncbi:membrane-associated progesterone receptor component 2 isoform X1 [Dasypus novemcinctus]|uniref:membrane-associated progesterone receptor component 2 isoform X1 n=1 Tax=Dasypus novemcinctus TaxID=9361 RepID=UPI00265D67DC|nr:membrane-associated progesterone receptor component 2 isoform X1 [Dasypus novemcinctus]